MPTSTTQDRGGVYGVTAICSRYGISPKLAAALILRLGIATKVGKSWVVRGDDLYQIEIALRGFPRWCGPRQEEGDRP